MSMNPAQTRVVDPVLTQVARGYKPASLVSTVLFPTVPVQLRGGKTIKFGAEEFAQYATSRAPGAAVQRITFNYSDEDYALKQHALSAQVPVENSQESSRSLGLNLMAGAVKKTQHIIAMTTEREAAALATTAGNYAASNRVALSGSDQWSNSGSKPSEQVEVAKEAIAQNIGLDPNVLVIGPAVLRALRNNNDVRDRIKYSKGGEVDLPLLATYFGVDQVVVGVARTGEPGDFVPLWGKNAVLAYTETSSLADMGSPSYGYTYQLSGYPIVEQPYYDKNHRSDVAQVLDERKAVLAGADAGYLFQTVVA